MRPVRVEWEVEGERCLGTMIAVTPYQEWDYGVVQRNGKFESIRLDALSVFKATEADIERVDSILDHGFIRKITVLKDGLFE